jgi:RNA polymerase sigma-70 factor (ECF subfamily)
MPTDEQLAAEVAKGDERALRELLVRYERPLSHFLHRYTGGRDVEDLYQETWIRVVRNADHFDPERRFSTWLFQIAVNLCRDWLRRPPPTPDEEAAKRETIGPGMERADAAVDASRLLATLPEPQREVVLLRFYHDLTEQQVAEVLDIPSGTVKSRMHNALRQLAAAVKSES